jgi:Leucine-rich repeat (LRR) protein
VTDDMLRVLREIGLLHALGEARGEGHGRAKDDASIEGLDLDDTKVTDAGLKELKGLKKLMTLNFSDNKVTDKRFGALCEAGLLHVLGQAKGEDDKQAKDDASIRSLDLHDTEVTGAVLKELKDLKQLTALKLRDTQVTNEALAALREFGLLHTLIRGTEYPNERGGAKDDASISFLDLHDTRVTDAGLKELKGLKNLTTLNLRGCRIRGEGLDDLKELKQLQQLDLRGTHVTTGDVKALSEALPRCRIGRSESFP